MSSNWELIEEIKTLADKIYDTQTRIDKIRYGKSKLEGAVKIFRYEKWTDKSKKAILREINSTKMQLMGMSQMEQFMIGLRDTYHFSQEEIDRLATILSDKNLSPLDAQKCFEEICANKKH